MKSTPRYSGHKSAAFWRRINRLPMNTRCPLYTLGCILQNTEHTVLRDLHEAERNMKGKRK